MTAFEISVQVFPEFESLVSVQWLRRIAEESLTAGSCSPEARLGVVVADDGAVRELNRRHRGLDESTDVLSFSFSHQGEYHGEGVPPGQAAGEVEFALPPGQEESLGEVIISYPKARAQAAQSGHSTDRELALLLTHGVLHLLGHDHEKPDEEVAMKALQDRVLAQVFTNSPE